MVALRAHEIFATRFEGAWQINSSKNGLGGGMLAGL